MNRSILSDVKIIAAAVVAVALLAGCASGGSTATKTHVTATASTATKSAPPVDPNAAACASVHDYITSTVTTTFHSWDPDADEFDSTVGDELRDEGTHLFQLSGRARSAVAAAITREATALTDMSIAIDESDDSALADASNAANSALAALRGTCDF